MIQLSLFVAFICFALMLPLGRASSIVCVAVIWLAGLLIALWLPENALDRYPAVAVFVHLVSYIFPVDRYTQGTIFHDVAAVYYSVTCLALPFASRLIFNGLRNHIYYYRKHHYRHGVPKYKTLYMDREQLQFGDYLLCIFQLIVFTLVFLMAWFYNGQDLHSERYSVFMNIGTSRLDLGLFGMFFPVVGVMCLSMELLLIKKLITGHP
jgi:hypothetical protein